MEYIEYYIRSENEDINALAANNPCKVIYLNNRNELEIEFIDFGFRKIENFQNLQRQYRMHSGAFYIKMNCCMEICHHMNIEGYYKIIDIDYDCDSMTAVYRIKLLRRYFR